MLILSPVSTHIVITRPPVLYILLNLVFLKLKMVHAQNKTNWKNCCFPATATRSWTIPSFIMDVVMNLYSLLSVAWMQSTLAQLMRNESFKASLYGWILNWSSDEALNSEGVATDSEGVATGTPSLVPVREGALTGTWQWGHGYW